MLWFVEIRLLASPQCPAKLLCKINFTLFLLVLWGWFSLPKLYHYNRIVFNQSFTDWVLLIASLLARYLNLPGFCRNVGRDVAGEWASRQWGPAVSPRTLGEKKQAAQLSLTFSTHRDPRKAATTSAKAPCSFSFLHIDNILIKELPPEP